MPQVHRVKRGPKTPALPKEVTITGPRELVDRFGQAFIVIWNGQRTDPALGDLRAYEDRECRG